MSIRDVIRRWRWRIAIVLAIVGAVWVMGGAFRAAPAAQDWFLQHGAEVSLVNVRVDGVSLAIPPFWKVTVHGDVVEPGDATPAYRSHMVILIEPFTGWTIIQAAN